MRRTLAGTGRLLITLGLLILAFVGYQLWGTSILQARAQNELEEEFAQIQADYDAGTEAGLSAVPGADPTGPDTSGADTTAPDTSEPSTTTTTEPDLNPVLEVGDDSTLTEGVADLSGIAVAPGDPLGRLLVPAANVEEFFVVGVSREDLKKGPGHYPGTPLPGSPGLSAVAGHRTTYGAPFYDLNNVAVRDDPGTNRQDRRGDVIVTETLIGTHVFEVVAKVIVRPTETWVASPVDAPVDPEVSQSRTNWQQRFADQYAQWYPESPAGERPELDADGTYIVLTTCNPRYSAAERLVVLGRLITDELDGAQGEEAVVVELPGDTEVIAELPTFEGAESFEEGLGGDPESLVPAILWALITLAVGLGWWWMYRHWRHPGTLFAGAAPFFAVLFAFYIFLEQLLPSGY